MWTVARVFELTTDDLRGRARVGRIVHARHVSIWLCRDMLPKPIITTSYIGRCHAKDHATALNACSRMGDRLAGDPSLAEHVSEIRKRINDACGTAA
jgi:chromosomal replication initiator protein